MTPNKWREYTPVIDAWSIFGVTPQLGGQADGGHAFGRYLYTPTLVTASLYLSFANPAGANPGSAGLGNYIIKLPVPCKPNVAGKATPGADRPLGVGNINRLILASGVEQPLTTVTALASDFGGVTYGGQPRDWAAMWSSRSYARGTGTIPTNASSVAVSFPYTLPATPNAEDISLQFTANPTTMIEGSGTATTATTTVTFAKTLTYTPSASDINVVWTGNPAPGSGTYGQWISGISTTGFTLNLRAAPNASAGFTYTLNGLGSTPWVSSVSTTGFTANLPSAPTTAATFTYKVDTPNSLLVGASSPVNFGAGPSGTYDSIFLALSYEPDV